MLVFGGAMAGVLLLVLLALRPGVIGGIGGSFDDDDDCDGDGGGDGD